MSVHITTFRLLIRKFVLEDWRDLLEIAVDKAGSKYAAYDHPFPSSENEVKAIIQWFAGDTQFLAVYEMAAQKVIGYISLNGENDKERNFGYTFHSKYWHTGYATEACIAVLNYAFNVLNLERITSGTANLNIPSTKLLLSLGFTKTGEQLVSFGNTPEGNPIEFTGTSYLLEKDAWTKKHLVIHS